MQNNGGHKENSENHTKALFFLVVKILTCKMCTSMQLDNRGEMLVARRDLYRVCNESSHNLVRFAVQTLIR